jgi:nicotinamide-nucleotide amidase
MAVRVEIITVGGEILSGLVSDTNRTYLSRELTGAGADVCWHATVGDRVADLVEAVRTALERADLVVVAGGLGSTPDDITRKAMARVLDRELVLSDKVLRHLKERMESLGRKLSPAMEAQALIPRGASVYFNPVGTAPAFAADRGNVRVWVLPGVPQEVEAITREHLLPEVKARVGEQRSAWTLLRTIGISEVTIAERIGHLARGGITISYLPQRCGVDVRVAARGGGAGEAQRKLESCKAEILFRLGDAVYCEGSSTLQQVVHGIILASGVSLAVAESCTGGMLAFMLMSEPGSSAYFERGVVAYSDRAKRELLGVPAAVLETYGAVSRQTAEAMAQGMKQSAGVDVAVSTTGIAGPGGERPGKPVGLVYVGLATDRGVQSWEHRFMGPRHEVIHRACCAALDAIRRRLREVA